ncbi:MAG: AsmA family protein [Flavobacteriaceae bacterium]|nr:AsmA family protein [Flavobacteriaceae bacterium]
MKKAFKIFGILVLFIIVAAVAVPIIFKDKLALILKEQINKNVNANVDFSDVDISIISTFPKAGLIIENLTITNFEPFKGDTLFYAKKIALKMPLSGLTKTAEDAIEINSFTIENALVNIISDANGNTNYDIAKKDNKDNTKETSTDSQKGFTFSVEEYAITNTEINYINQESELSINLTDFNHSGSGDLSADISNLKTITTSNISVNSGDSNYLNNNTIALKADLEIDQLQNKYTFLENSLKLNQLELIFDGFVKQNETNTEFNLTFNTPTSDFKNFLAVLPAEYSKDINKVQTNGSFTIKGFAKGIMDDANIPKFNVNIVSENASFKYPELPKSVKNINLNTTIANTTGKTKDIFLDLDKLSFQIDQDIFNASGKIKHLTNNRYVDMNLDGTLNLGNISQAYPIQLDNELKGILKANLHTSFSQSAIDNNAYEQIKNNGDFSISNFEFSSKDIVNPIYISEAAVDFTPQKVYLRKLDVKSGESDIHGTGTIDNLMGFLFSNKKLKGDFNLNSTLFKVSDFMVDNTTESENAQKESEKGDALKIPAFLDTKITANAKKVIYDDLVLENVTGDVIIKDETVTLKNVTAELFEGTMSINGNVSTKNETPTFNMDLGIDKFDIAKSFNGMDLLSSIAPVAKMLQGKLNTVLKLKGNLDDSFSLDLNSLTGNAIAEVLTTKVTPEKASVISKLNNQLSFIDLNKLNLKDLKTALKFENGKVSIKPFDIQYEDIKVQIAGSHSFENILGYTATFDVPAKYFGNEVGDILSKLSDDDVKNVTVPVIANIGGTMASPKVSTDMKQSVKNLTNQLIQIQKNKLLGQGTDAVTDAIGDAIGNDAGGIVGDILGGILGGGNSNTPKDTTATNNSNNNNTIEDGVKNVLGGLFGGKKKKKKDSVK